MSPILTRWNLRLTMQEFIEAPVARDDTDALVVVNFESELQDFLQEAPEICAALASYMEARSKLVEKRKNRGFWPTKKKHKHTSMAKVLEGF